MRFLNFLFRWGARAVAALPLGGPRLIETLNGSPRRIEWIDGAARRIETINGAARRVEQI